MKKLLISSVFLFLVSFSFAQMKPKAKNLDPIDSVFIKTCDSLSIVSKKNVKGYSIGIFGNKKITTIYYLEDDRIKELILETLSIEPKFGSSNRAINFDVKVRH